MTANYRPRGPADRVRVARTRSVAVVAVALLGWSAARPWDYIYAGQPDRDSRPARSASRPKTPGVKLAESLAAVDRLFAQLEARSSQHLAAAGPGKALAPLRLTARDRAVLTSVREQIEARGESVTEQLDAIGERLAASSLPGEILARHREKEAQIRDGLAALRSTLLDLEGADADLPARLAQARAALDEAAGPSRHNPLDPLRLPLRPAEPERRAPRTEASQFLGDAGAAIPLKATPPTPADVAETLDAQFSQGIVDLAASLGGDPLAIYNWVRQNILFVPTFGSIQGSEGCRLSLECNAHDTASLLIALLRSSGVPARYVVGTVEVEPDFFRSAMGDFADLTSAANLAASGGIATVTVGDGQGNVTAVRIEHVWVEAFVDYIPSRGQAAGDGETWVPLDAALKTTRFQAPVDIGALTGSDPLAIADELDNGVVVGADGSLTLVPTAAAAEDFVALVEAVEPALDSTLPNATVGDVFGGLSIEAGALPLLPASLRARVLTVGGRTAELPASVRHRVVVEALDRFGFPAGLNLEMATVELADKRLTLHYAPASEADIAVIESFGGLYTAPPYLVDVEPQLLLEGTAVTSGSAVTMGTQQTLKVSFHEPGRSDSVEHQVSAGTYAAIALDLQRVSREQSERREARLEAVEEELLDFAVDTNFDDVVGETLHNQGQSYFLQVEASNRVSANQLGVRAIKRPAEGLVTFAPQFGFIFGSPVDIGGTSFNIDVRRYLVSTASLTGDDDRELQYMLHTGGASSALEHAVFENTEDSRSVSAVKLLAEANSLGIPIYQIDSSNLAQVLPLLSVSTAVRADVINSVNAGKIVTVPQHPFQFLNWSGLGYLVLDPVTGAGGYLISGGLAGGGTAEDGDGNDALGTLIMFLSWIANQGGDDVVIKALGKILAGFEAIKKVATWVGNIAIGVSALYTAYSTWKETGSLWKTVATGLVDLAASLIVGAIIGTAAIGALSLGWTIVAILVISIAFTFLVNFINGLIINAIASWIRLRHKARDRLARHPVSPFRIPVGA